MRVLVLSTLSRLIPRAGEVASFPHATAFGQDRLERVDFSGDRPGLDRIGRARLPVRLPPAAEPLAFELFDPVTGDLVENHGPEKPVYDLQRVPVSLGAALVELGVVAYVNLSERPERDVRLGDDRSRDVRSDKGRA